MTPGLISGQVYCLQGMPLTCFFQHGTPYMSATRRWCANMICRPVQSLHSFQSYIASDKYIQDNTCILIWIFTFQPHHAAACHHTYGFIDSCLHFWQTEHLVPRHFDIFSHIISWDAAFIRLTLSNTLAKHWWEYTLWQRFQQNLHLIFSKHHFSHEKESCMCIYVYTSKAINPDYKGVDTLSFNVNITKIYINSTI